MKNLIINSSNSDPGTNNSSYTLNFKTNFKFEEGDTIGVQSILIPYSWFNITSQYGNNSFGYSIGSFQYNIPIQDGFYTITDLNLLLQTQFLKNGHYLIDVNGDYVFFGNLSQNTNYYKIQWDSTPIPLTLPTGYTNPAGVLYSGSLIPTAGHLFMPHLIVPNNAFSNIIGFLPGSYPSNAVGSDPQTVSSSIGSLTPNFSPVNAINMRCNLVNNKYTNPSDQFFSFSNSDTKFGSNIVINNSSIGWIDVQPGNYQKLNIKLQDQNYNNINFQDNNVCFQLLIKSKGE